MLELIPGVVCRSRIHLRHNVLVLSFGAFGLDDGPIIVLSSCLKTLQGLLNLDSVDLHGVDVVRVVRKAQGTVKGAIGEACGPELLQALGVHLMQAVGQSHAILDDAVETDAHAFDVEVLREVVGIGTDLHELP